MNLRKQLLEAHSRANADLVQAHVVAHPESLPELMACFFSDEVIVAQRASQVVGNLGRAHPDWLEPYWSEMVASAISPVHSATRRSVTRYFSELKLEIPTTLEKELVDHCTNFVADPNEDVAIGAFSMTFVADRAAQYPQHAQRLEQALILLIPKRSTGFQNRGRKVLKQLEKLGLGRR